MSTEMWSRKSWRRREGSRASEAGSLIAGRPGRKCGPMKLLPHLAVIALLGLSALNVGGAPLELKPDDTIVSILRAQAGQVVDLRLGSGEKVGGKVEIVGDN